MTKSRYTDEDREHAEKQLLAMFPEPGYRVATVTVYGKGQRDYVEVFGVSTYDGRPEVTRCTYWVAILTDRRMTEKGIPMDGGNYSKADEIVMSLSRRLHGRDDALTTDKVLGVTR